MGSTVWDVYMAHAVAMIRHGKPVFRALYFPAIFVLSIKAVPTDNLEIIG